VVVVLDRSPFAKELGLKGDVEIDAFALSRFAFEKRNEDVFHGSRNQRRTKHDDVGALLAPDPAPEIGGESQDGTLILAPVRGTRGPDADERHLRGRDGSATFVVTRTRPLFATAAMRSTMPSSTTGVRPSAMRFSLEASMSTPTTW
jgi:hypothetical protein